MNPTAPEVSIIIPCYRDAPHLAQGVAEVAATLERARWRWEIILVNDASPDDCAAVIDRLIREHPRWPLRALHHAVNTGRGRAVMDGVEASRGGIAGFIDIDLEVHARYIPALVRAIEEGVDVASAYRVYRVRPGVMLRAALSKGYLKLVNLLLGTRMKDTEAGYKFFRRERILPLFPRLRNNGWFWDTEVMVRAERAGLRVGFVPALFLRRPDKASTVRLARDTLDYLRCLLAFRRELRGQAPAPAPPAEALATERAATRA